MNGHRVIRAVEQRDDEHLRRAIAEGDTLDACDPHGRTALLIAIARGDAVSVERLLDAGARPDAHERRAEQRLYERLGTSALADPRGTSTLLHQASAWVGSGEVVRRLLARGYALDAHDDQGATPLMLAAQTAPNTPSGISPLEVLLAAGANVNALDRHCRTALDVTYHTWALEKLLAAGADPNGGPWSRGHSGAPPLLTRWAMGLEERGLEVLLRAGAEPARHPGAVTHASHFGRLGCLEKLLDAGADPNDYAHDYASAPPALAAGAASGHAAIVRRLLAVGATAVDFALYSAAGRSPVSLGPDLRERLDERLEVVRLLLDAGARPDGYRDALGLGALHLAAQCACLPIVERLLAAGADVHARASNGETPLFVAAERGCADVVARLLSAGAEAATTNAAGISAHAIARESKSQLAEIYPGSGEQLQVMRLLRAAGGAPTEAAPVAAVAEAKSDAARLGARVRHAKFGEGTVLGVAGVGEGAKITVEFDAHGQKTLLARFVTATP